MTKTIYLNNYELHKKDLEKFQERLFELKSEDIGKILRVNLSYSNIIKESKDGKKLRNDKMLLLEGRHLIKEAMFSKCVSLNRIFYTDYFLKNQENLNFFNMYLEKVSKIKINQDVMNAWSHLKTNQGIIGN